MCYRMSEISRHPVVAATRALRFADHVTKRNEGSGNENAVVAATRALRFADHVTKRNEGSGNENGLSPPLGYVSEHEQIQY